MSWINCQVYVPGRPIRDKTLQELWVFKEFMKLSGHVPESARRISISKTESPDFCVEIDGEYLHFEIVEATEGCDQRQWNAEANEGGVRVGPLPAFEPDMVINQIAQALDRKSKKEYAKWPSCNLIIYLNSRAANDGQLRQAVAQNIQDHVFPHNEFDGRAFVFLNSEGGVWLQCGS